MQAPTNPNWWPGAGLVLAILALHGYPVVQPVLWHDDFQIMSRATTWARTWDSLWEPHNEHAMPLGRVSTWLLLQAAGGQSNWPRVGVLQGVVALLLGVALVHQFVRGELGRSLHGWLAASLFGVTAVYQQAVIWFAASFSLLTFNTLLLALLAAQSWHQHGGAARLVLCGLGCALAPGWFASGVVAGPLCAFYLLAASREQSWLRTLMPAVVPLLGTLVFLAVSLPRTAGQIMHVEHYQGKTALEAFDLFTGLIYAFRSLTDNLLLGSVGLTLGFFPTEVNIPTPIGIALAAGFLGVLTVLWRNVPDRRLLGLGLGLIGLTYALTYGARAAWLYDGVFNRPNWSRYHLLPQFGLTLLLIGALKPRAAGPLTRREARGAAALCGMLLVTQLPRAVLGMSPGYPDQQAAFQRIERLDIVCQERRIAAEQARQALGHIPMPGAHAQENGVMLLRGSSNPRVYSPHEVRELLKSE